jgi:hypothetical protein
VNGEGFDVVYEFLSNPMLFLFMLLCGVWLCWCSCWICGILGKGAFKPIHHSNSALFSFKDCIQNCTAYQHLFIYLFQVNIEFKVLNNKQTNKY